MSWVLIRSGEAYTNWAGHMEWQLDDASDIDSPPPEAVTASPGSLAWTGDYTHVYNKKNDGTWVDIIGGA